MKVDASEGWYQLTSFDVTINKLNWKISYRLGGEGSLFWRPFESEKPAFVIRDRYGIPSKRLGMWILGSPRFPPTLLIASDSWAQFAFNPPTNVISGSWEVTQRPTTTPIPEPASILSLTVLGASSLLMTRKNYKN